MVREGPALRRFKRNLAARDSHPLAAALSDMFADESFTLDVRDLEAECDARIGAVRCPDQVPHGWEHSVTGEMSGYAAPCPSCGAVL